jgi:hypothetical protein
MLQPNTTYYFYDDGDSPGVVALPGDPIGPFAGYMTHGFPNLDTTPFQKIGTLNYRLSGDPVPEPSSYSLLAIALAMLLLVTSRRSPADLRNASTADSAASISGGANLFDRIWQWST